MPLMVAMTTTRLTKATVFFVPITLRITSMLGRLSAGPASSSASAGPLPMPAPSKPCRIGHLGQGGEIHERTHYRGKQVGPQRVAAHQPADPFGGDQALVAGAPSSSPATSTPANSSGRICLAKPQVDMNQLSVSPRVVVVR